MTRNIDPPELQEVEALIKNQDLAGSLELLAAKFGEEATFSTSFSLEDQIITHIIFSLKLPIAVFTLDTGRLFAETYGTWSATLEKYHGQIIPYFPKAEALEAFVGQNGPNSFYDSIANRKTCCHIRKVEPLARALAGKKLWITGIRAGHSANRMDLTPVEYDGGNQLVKFHPLLNWTAESTLQFVAEHQIPVNPLHQQGFVSIGCAPCTRAIQPGEDFRAGRWWWEDADKKECGLHVSRP